MILSDMHVHTAFSPDSAAPMAAQVERAVALGLKTIALTDHADWDYRTKRLAAPFDIAGRRKAFDGVTARYGGQIRVIWGVESGIYDDPAIIANVRAFLAELKPDFVIGSLHDYRGEDFYGPPYYRKRTKAQAYGDYFAAMLSCVRACDWFHTLGHMDYMARYARYDEPAFRCEDHAETIDEILKALIGTNRAIELNTAGVRHGVFHARAPILDVLRRYRELGGTRVTVGSDAHAPEWLGAGFDEAAAFLTDCGFGGIMDLSGVAK